MGVGLISAVLPLASHDAAWAKVHSDRGLDAITSYVSPLSPLDWDNLPGAISPQSPSPNEVEDEPTGTDPSEEPVPPDDGQRTASTRGGYREYDAAAAAGPSFTPYQVRPGDALLRIAARLGVDAGEIARANRLYAPYFLLAGQTLQIPASFGREPDVARTPGTGSSDGTRMIVPGDTVLGLARATGVPAAVIIAANGLAFPYLLRVGRELIIPGEGGAAHGGAASAASGPAAEPPALAAESAVPSPEADDFGSRIVELVLQFRGYRYTWGGVSPRSGFDCSGLVYHVYQQAGRPIPRDLYGQLNAGTRVGRDELQPGDIVFFANTYMRGLSHDGIYIGGGLFISAVDEGTGVAISGLDDAYWRSRFYGASRP